MFLIGYDLLLGSIAAFYVFMAPYTKVEESFNIQVLLLFPTSKSLPCSIHVKHFVLFILNH